MVAVSLGKTSLTGMAAGNHWAVRVGQRWYEYVGTAPELRSKCAIRVQNGATSAEGAGMNGRTFLVGNTSKRDAEISDFVGKYEMQNPQYCSMSINCQKFAVEFIEWLTNGNCDISAMQSAGLGVHINARTAFSGSNGEESRAAYRLGHLAAEGTVVAGKAEGPGVMAQVGKGGAFIDVEACRVEGSVGGIVGAAFCPNISTGAGMRNGNVEAKLLGTGLAVGQDGLKVATPLFEIKLDALGWLVGGTLCCSRASNTCDDYEVIPNTCGAQSPKFGLITDDIFVSVRAKHVLV